ncbi:glycosyltransferase [Winogradskyella sp. 3972H.M.0a.05]|uniref:glycosyltransferase family 4 protein n=1 Tax=Winogradskyella sp. 3972H.M.0a.05 TaxID=2950277 RepID=UPI003395BF19
MNKAISNILIFTSEFPPLPGGIGNHAFNLAKQLSLNGFKVEVLADRRSKGDEEEAFDNKSGFTVHRVPLRKIRTLMYVQRILLLFRLVRQNEVIIASGKFPLWLVGFSSLFYKRKFLAIAHGSEVNFTKKLLKSSIESALKRFDSVIAVSHFTKSLISHLPLKDLHVIRNGFNATNWNKDKVSNLDLKGYPKLLTVGNVTSRKGQHNVIRHLSKLLESFPDAHYHCVGFPTQKDEFIELAKQLNVDDHITFHGSVDHGELEDFYKSTDIFVMLSSITKTGDVEGFGIAVIEANYFGLPALGSLGCGLEDAIKNEASGFLMKPEDEASFITAIESILKDKETYKSASVQWAEHHRWSKVIKDYIEVITA